MCRVLIIDDDKRVRLSMRAVLEANGFDVGEASDGIKGVAYQRADPYDVAIVDLVMPHKEGLETIRELRAEYPSLGIIAISGGGTVVRRNFLPAAEEFGAGAVLEKPFDGDDLLTAVSKVQPSAA